MSIEEDVMGVTTVTGLERDFREKRQSNFYFFCPRPLCEGRKNPSHPSQVTKPVTDPPLPPQSVWSSLADCWVMTYCGKFLPKHNQRLPHFRSCFMSSSSTPT